MTRLDWGVAGAIAAAATIALAASAASAQTYKKQEFNVVGSFGNLSPYNVNEKPFWQKEVPNASGGAITGKIVPFTELGLKGFEVLKLLSSGVYDIAHGVIGYVAEDPVFEGPDLAIIAQDIDTARKITDAYKPVLDKAFQEKFNAKLLTLTSYPSQMLYCKPEIKSIGDFKGKKIRVYSTTLGDFVEALGGTGVTVTFAEVVPALQRGVVDCGITGTMPAYAAKWYEVANYVMPLRVGWGIAFTAANLKKWNGLDAATRDFMTKQMAQLENETWETIRKEDAQGLICNTGVGGKCETGEPGGMKLVTPSAADVAERDRIMKEVIIKRWAERCEKASPGCVKSWNETVGKVIGVTAKAG
jgi:TRAP-type C4-dicarboxylate transport system substrate-binding protein